MTVAESLAGARLVLRPFRCEDISERYLDWLGDVEVNCFSQRFGQTRPSPGEARRWLESRGPEELVYKTIDPALDHVGNIKAGPIDRANGRADISILIGDREAWHRGVGAEAVTC